MGSVWKEPESHIVLLNGIRHHTWVSLRAIAQLSRVVHLPRLEPSLYEGRPTHLHRMPTLTAIIYCDSAGSVPKAKYTYMAVSTRLNIILILVWLLVG